VLLACFCENASKCVIWGWNLLCFWMWHSVVVARHHCSGGVCIMFRHYIPACLKLCDLTSHNTVIFIAMKTSKSLEYPLLSWIAVYSYRKTIYIMIILLICFMCHKECDATVYLRNLHPEFLYGCGRFLFIQLKFEFVFQCRQFVGASRVF